MTAERQKSGAGGLRSARDLYRFKRQPGTYCHSDHIAALLPPGLPSSFRERLQGSKRLRSRLSTLLTRRFALETCSSDDLESPEGQFAQLEGPALRETILGVGAVWHAHSLRRIILAEQLRRLIDQLGRENYRRALGMIDLAPKGEQEPTDPDGKPDIDALIALIKRDGLLAINAWSHHQPEAIAKRLRLKLPPDGVIDGEPKSFDLERSFLVVDRVVFSLAGKPSPSEGVQ